MYANNIADTIANLESSSCDAPLGAKKIKGFNTPVCVHFHSIRRRLADSDGISGKAALDGIVKAGLLQDDSPQFVEKVSHSQEKSKESEKTVITITSCSYSKNEKATSV